MKQLFFVAAAMMALLTTACNNTTATNAVSGSNVSANRVVDTSFDGVAYINTDSLIQGYQMFKDLNEEFTVKAEKVERELNSKGAKFELDLKTFQNKIDKGLLTRTEAQIRQQELEQEQKLLLEFRDAKLAELREEEMVMMNKVSESIRTYIKSYNETKKYKMILNTSASMNVVLAADPSTDVTKEILDNLNAAYKPGV